eukprot:2545752-Rhodomonas_salina.2
MPEEEGSVRCGEREGCGTFVHGAIRPRMYAAAVLLVVFVFPVVLGPVRPRVHAMALPHFASQPRANAHRCCSTYPTQMRSLPPHPAAAGRVSSGCA